MLMGDTGINRYHIIFSDFSDDTTLNSYLKMFFLKIKSQEISLNTVEKITFKKCIIPSNFQSSEILRSIANEYSGVKILIEDSQVKKQNEMNIGNILAELLGGDMSNSMQGGMGNMSRNGSRKDDPLAKFQESYEKMAKNPNYEQSIKDAFKDTLDKVKSEGQNTGNDKTNFKKLEFFEELRPNNVPLLLKQWIIKNQKLLDPILRELAGRIMKLNQVVLDSVVNNFFNYMMYNTPLLMFLVGLPGVGKTALGDVLASFLAASEYIYSFYLNENISINLNDKQTIRKIIVNGIALRANYNYRIALEKCNDPGYLFGIKPNYVGANPGELFASLRKSICSFKVDEDGKFDKDFLASIGVYADEFDLAVEPNFDPAIPSLLILDEIDKMKSQNGQEGAENALLNFLAFVNNKNTIQSDFFFGYKAMHVNMTRIIITANDQKKITSSAIQDRLAPYLIECMSPSGKNREQIYQLLFSNACCNYGYSLLKKKVNMILGPKIYKYLNELTRDPGIRQASGIINASVGPLIMAINASGKIDQFNEKLFDDLDLFKSIIPEKYKNILVEDQNLENSFPTIIVSKDNTFLPISLSYCCVPKEGGSENPLYLLRLMVVNKEGRVDNYELSHYMKAVCQSIPNMFKNNPKEGAVWLTGAYARIKKILSTKNFLFEIHSKNQYELEIYKSEFALLLPFLISVIVSTEFHGKINNNTIPLMALELNGEAYSLSSTAQYVEKIGQINAHCFNKNIENEKYINYTVEEFPASNKNKYKYFVRSGNYILNGKSNYIGTILLPFRLTNDSEFIQKILETAPDIRFIFVKDINGMIMEMVTTQSTNKGV